MIVWRMPKVSGEARRWPGARLSESKLEGKDAAASRESRLSGCDSAARTACPWQMEGRKSEEGQRKQSERSEGSKEMAGWERCGDEVRREGAAAYCELEAGRVEAEGQRAGGASGSGVSGRDIRSSAIAQWIGLEKFQADDAGEARSSSGQARKHRVSGLPGGG